MHELKKDLEITKRELIETKIDMDKNNQYGRREMIRLHNVTEPVLSANTYERVEDTVVNVLKDAGYEIDASMIASAQRLPVKKAEGGQTYAKPITFKLTSRFNRNSILREQKLKMRENLRFQGKHKKVFMTEDLTPIRQHISFKLRKDTAIAKVWSIDGRIKCLKDGFSETDRPITIDSPYDLKKLGWNEPKIMEVINANLIKDKQVPVQV